MNLIWIETWNWNLKLNLETETWNRNLKLELETETWNLNLNLKLETWSWKLKLKPGCRIGETDIPDYLGAEHLYWVFKSRTGVDSSLIWTFIHGSVSFRSA